MSCPMIRLMRLLNAVCVASLLLVVSLLPATRIMAAVSINVSPANGPVGTAVTVNGTLDGNGNSFEVQWDGAAVTTGVAPAGSNSISVTFNIPVATAGAHTITLIDKITNGSASTTFTVLPSVSISPTSGPVGTQVTITGKGFAANETGISLSYNSTAIDYTVVVDNTGSWSASFNIPDSPSGVPHSITATRSSGTTVTASQNFTVTPTLTISPTSGPVGTQITVTGKGFAANETITITVNGETARTGTTTDAQGSWQSTLPFPDNPSGIHSISAYGSTTTATSVPEKTFTVKPAISLSPTSGTVGTQVTITGTGFAANETGITVLLDNIMVGQGINADRKGRWTTTFNIPSGTGGTRTISAYGNVTTSSQVAAVLFNIMSRIAISPSSGFVGDTVNVTGQSFGTNETGITVLYDGTPVTTNITASASGDWTATFTVPPSTSGNHRIGAYGPFTPQTSVPEQTFTVKPKLTITPTTGAVGSQITIHATGLNASKNITITYDDQPITVSQPQTTPQGNLSTTFNAPKSKAGTHIIKLSDGVNLLSAEWTMENNPPPIPTPSKPANGELIGWFGNDPVTFKWSEVQDPSGVSYTLHVSQDESFSSLVIKQENLSKPEFTTNPLPLGTYYWRVKAIDGADNASNWSTTSSVRIGIMPLWTFITLTALVFALLIAVILLLLRRKKQSTLGIQPEKRTKAQRKGKPELERPAPASEAEVTETEVEQTPPPSAETAGPETPASELPVTQPEASFDETETEEMIIRAVSGLTDSEISLLAQREDLRRRGITLAKLYKTCSRLEQEGRLVRDQNNRYQPSTKPVTVKPTQPEPTPTRTTPLDEEKMTRDRTAPRTEPKITSEAAPTTQPAPRPEPKPTVLADEIDPEIELLVANSVAGMSDAEITQVAQSEIIRARGLTLAKVYKIVSRLEKSGRLIRDEKGRYQKVTEGTTAKPPSREELAPAAEKPKPGEPSRTVSTAGMEDYRPFQALTEKPPVTKETKETRPETTRPTTTPEELYELVIEAIVGQTDADIPQIAQRADLKARGLNLARIYQITTRLEREGKLTRDDAGYYRRPSEVSKKPEAPKPTTTIEWTGTLPWQQWTSFYSQVIMLFQAEERPSITVSFKAGPGASFSSERLEETKAALEELGLDTKIKAEPRKDVTARFTSVEWSGTVPWQKWEVFFARVLSRFLAEPSFSISVTMKAVSGAGFNQARVKDTISALRNLSLNTDLKTY